MFKIKSIFGRKKEQTPERVVNGSLANAQRQTKVGQVKVAGNQQNEYRQDNVNITNPEAQLNSGLVNGLDPKIEIFPSIPVDEDNLKIEDIERSASMSGTTKVSSQRSMSDSNCREFGERNSAVNGEPAETVYVSEEEYEDSSMTTGSQIEDDQIPERKFAEQNELKGYLLINKIGEGAFSAVFRGIPDKSSSQSFLSKSFSEVAIKVIMKKELSSESGVKKNNKITSREQVLKEVKIHKLVSSGSESANIVKFIDFQESEHYYYIIQEILSGGEIFGEIVKYTYFSEDLSRHVIKQLAKAIKHLHSMGVVHRDIKPENLLFEPITFKPSKEIKLRRSDDPSTKVDEGEFQPGTGGGGIGVVKLADFGLSKQIYETNTKTPCGTVGYTAPEVVKDERYSMKVDMWGIGCVLYTLLCGFPPFYDEKIDILTEKISRGEYCFLRPWWDEISPGAKNCVRRLLEVDPNKRYGVDELLNDQWLNSFDSFEWTSQPLHQKRKSKSHLHHKKKIALLQKDSSLLYSPAANAMRDAFDVSNALQRKHDEKRAEPVPRLCSLAEDDEDFPINIPKNYDNSNKLEENMFQLSLNSSTILKRRNKNEKPTGIPIATIIE